MLEPIAKSRWGFGAAAHLLNRAGFGGGPEEVESLVRLGPEGAVDRLLEPRKPESPVWAPEWAKPDPERAAKVRQMRNATAEERRAFQREQQAEERRRTLDLRQGWIRRMVESAHPLEERMVLFWHGHFATSVQKVREAWLMYRQLDLFREHAMGHWPALLRAVTRDPAMLIWLDQAQSRREHPNENYAREVMELFALGEGHYTERDIHETARALTGLTYDRVNQECVWRPRQHDPGVKTVLGRSGNLGPDEVITHIAEQPQSGRFLAGKLWKYFASENPPAPLVEALAAKFREGGHTLRPLLRSLFLSSEFHAPEVVRTQIKSPVHWLVMALRQTRHAVPPPEVVTAVLRDLGQELLAPPNVKGWDGGVAWINTGTLTRRREYAALLVQGREAVPEGMGAERGERTRRRRMARDNPGAAASRVQRLFEPAELSDRARLMSALERRFLQARFRPSLAGEVLEVLGDDREPDPRAVVEAVRTVMQSTDYQLV
jgi:uncharacterized protein (DUF1800 family)